MKARGKREAKRSASPLVRKLESASSPERAEYYFGLSGLVAFFVYLSRDDALSRLPLAFIFRAVGAPTHASSVASNCSIRVSSTRSERPAMVGSSKITRIGKSTWKV